MPNRTHPGNRQVIPAAADRAPWIGMICGGWPPVRCGVADYAQQLAQSMSRQGHVVKVYHTRAQRFLDWEQAGTEPFRSLEFSALRRAIISEKPDLLLAHSAGVGMPKFGLPLQLMRWRSQTALPTCLIWICHEYASLRWTGHLRLQTIFSTADAVVFTNQADRLAAATHRPSLRANSWVVPLGSNLGDPPPQFFRRPEAGTIIHFGTIMPNKGWDILIPLMKILRPRFPGLRFRIIGDLQPLRYAFHRRLHTALRANNLDSWVEFTGFLEPSAVQRLFAAATLAVQPFTEGALLNRTSLLALLLHGVPVVTQPPVRQAEHLRPGWHYAAPAARTAEDYAQTVEILLAQPPEREAFGVRAAELRAVFHWDAIARSMESVIRSVCAHA